MGGHRPPLQQILHNTDALSLRDWIPSVHTFIQIHRVFKKQTHRRTTARFIIAQSVLHSLLLVRPMPKPSALDRRSFLKLGALSALVAPGLLEAAAASPSSALSKLRERSLSFYNLHTSENLKTVYWQDGQYLVSSLADINRILRDHRTGEKHEIDARLLDMLCGLGLRLETKESLQIISGYRSPATNALLHAASGGVAERSLHMDGKAIDIRIPGRSLSLLRKTALSMKAGGVGYYPSSNFVHVDVGRVRSW